MALKIPFSYVICPMLYALNTPAPLINCVLAAYPFVGLIPPFDVFSNLCIPLSAAHAHLLPLAALGDEGRRTKRKDKSRDFLL